MTQAEMQFGMTHDEGLPVFTILEDGILHDTLFLAQGTFQQQIGGYAQPLALLELETQGLLAALATNGS